MHLHTSIAIVTSAVDMPASTFLLAIIGNYAASETKKTNNKKKGDSGKADEVAHPHEHVSIITIFWFPGTAGPSGDAAIGHICCVLRRRVVQHSCDTTHNQSESGSGGSSVCSTAFLWSNSQSVRQTVGLEGLVSACTSVIDVSGCLGQEKAQLLIRYWSRFPL